MEEKTVKELIPMLDKEFSLSVRLSAADESGFIICPTCGKPYHWKQMDCSHYINRNKKAVRWNEQNVIAQCQSENRFQSGSIWKLRKVLVKRHGEEEIQRIEHLAEYEFKLDKFWLIEMINLYRDRVKKIKKEKGL